MTDETWKDEREIRISADPETVWAAWAEPEHVRRWFSDHARGQLEAGAEIVHEFEGHGEHRYTVVEVDAPHRLVLEGEMDGRAFRQTTEIRQEGGTTVLRLVHSGFGSADPDSEIVQGIDSGWSMALAVMKHYVEDYFGRSKRAIPVFRPARFEYDALLNDLYLDGEGLARWLTEGGTGIQRDRPLHLRMKDGRTLTGAVLALTDHEIAVTWPEVDGVLEFKAFGAGPDQRFLGLRLVTWSEDGGVPGSVGPGLEEAVGRLTEVLRTARGKERAGPVPAPPA